MSTIGVVAISLFCGLFLAVLLSGLGVLIWLAMNLRKALAALRLEAVSVSSETRAVLAQYQTELARQIESSKSSFGVIRNDMKALLDEHRKKTTSTLEEHRQKMQAGIDRINADALQGAAARAIQACLRLEKAVGVIQQLFLNTEEKVTHEYGPDEFAPEETAFSGPPSGYMQSQTARYDEQVEQVRDPEESNQSELFAPQE